MAPRHLTPLRLISSMVPVGYINSWTANSSWSKPILRPHPSSRSSYLLNTAQFIVLTVTARRLGLHTNNLHHLIVRPHEGRILNRVYLNCSWSPCGGKGGGVGENRCIYSGRHNR